MRCDFCFLDCLNAIMIRGEKHGKPVDRPMCTKCFRTWLATLEEINLEH